MNADFESLRFFHKVAETLSFVQAANDLNIQKSLLSRRIAELENQIGIRLFQRTTRKVTLTEEGQVFLQEIKDGVHIFEQAIATVQSTRSAPQGTVRISTPIEFGLFLLDHIMPGFFETYPHVKIEWDFSGEKRNLLQHRLDLVIRAGIPIEDTLEAKEIATLPFYAYVSPKLKLPKITSSADISFLENLPWVRFQRQNIRTVAREKLKFSMYGKDYEIMPKNVVPYIANNLTAVKNIVRLGYGIGFIPKNFLIEQDLADGTLIELNPTMKLKEQTGLYLVYPSKSFIPPKTRVLSDWILTRTKEYLSKMNS